MRRLIAALLLAAGCGKTHTQQERLACSAEVMKRCVEANPGDYPAIEACMDKGLVACG
jgi:hypothetical protein